MKFLLCLVALIVTVQSLTDEQKANWKKWSGECQSETGVSDEAIIKVRNNDLSGLDDKMKAHGLCFGKKTGLIKASGDIDEEDIKTKLRRVVDSEDQVNEIVQKCNVKKSSPIDTAFSVYKCLKDNRPNFTLV